MKPMNKIKPFTLLFIMAALTAIDALLWTTIDRDDDVRMWMQANAAEQAMPAEAITVSETTVTETEWAEIVEATGSIAAWQEAVIGAEISGQRLVAVLANVGDTVKKGQVLATFNTEMLMAEVAEMQANWMTAESNRKRALKLKNSGAMSEQSIDDYVNQAAVAKARLDVKTLQLKYTSVVAPDDGVISARNATLGVVGSSGDELFRLIRQNKLEWLGELTAEDALHITKGQSVTLTLPNGDRTEGAIRQIAPAFNPETRLTTVFVDLKTGSAKAGMYAQGQIVTRQQVALSVPAQSVAMRDGYHYVFSLSPPAAKVTVSQRKVEIGQVRNGMAQILFGLSNGERIVLNGATFLNDGDNVRVVAEQGGKP